MTYKSISAVLTACQRDQIVLDTARLIARQNKAHLDVYIVCDKDCVRSDEYCPAFEAQQDDLLKDRGITVHKIIGINTVPARLTRYCDLIVLGQSQDPSLHKMILDHRDTPVLILSEQNAPQTQHTPIFDRVLIAWDEGSEAFRAIRAALPILNDAHSVDLVMVDPPADSPERSDPGGGVCMMLLHHGIKTEVSVLAKSDRNITDALIDFAKNHRNTVIITGFCLNADSPGATTAGLLGKTDLPLFMAR